MAVSERNPSGSLGGPGRGSRRYGRALYLRKLPERLLVRGAFARERLRRASSSSQTEERKPKERARITLSKSPRAK